MTQQIFSSDKRLFQIGDNNAIPGKIRYFFVNKCDIMFFWRGYLCTTSFANRPQLNPSTYNGHLSYRPNILGAIVVRWY